MSYAIRVWVGAWRISIGPILFGWDQNGDIDPSSDFDASSGRDELLTVMDKLCAVLWTATGAVDKDRIEEALTIQPPYLIMPSCLAQC